MKLSPATTTRFMAALAALLHFGGSKPLAEFGSSAMAREEDALLEAASDTKGVSAPKGLWTLLHSCVAKRQVAKKSYTIKVHITVQ